MESYRGGYEKDPPKSEPDKSFKEKVEEEKMNRIHNISYNLLPGQETVLTEYFTEHGINLNSVRQNLKDIEGASENSIDARLPDIYLNDNKEQIINELLSLEPWKGDFKTPENLMEAVQQYILSNMSYDLLTSIKIMKEGLDYEFIFLSEAGLNADEPISEARKEYFKQQLKDSKIQYDSQVIDELQNTQELHQYIQLLHYSKVFHKTGFKTYHLEKFKEKLSQLALKEHTLSQSEEFKAMLELCNKKDVDGFNQLFTDLLDSKTNLDTEKEPLFRIVSESMEDFKWFEAVANYENASEARTYLKELNIGVCRHFAIIAKQLYNTLSHRLESESELIHVSNYRIGHAYNLLFYEDENGQIHKEYYDLTGGITELKEEEFTAGEIRVHNSRKTHQNLVGVKVG